MTTPRKPRSASTHQRGKSNRKPRKRATPIVNWLAFIRPHLKDYSLLPYGGQLKFIEGLAKTTGSSLNTLRRYIGAAEFLESFGIKEFPAGVKHMPVAAVEMIARISKQNPEAGRYFLDGLLRGSGTILRLKQELDALRKAGRPRRQDDHAMRISKEPLFDLIEELLRSEPVTLQYVKQPGLLHGPRAGEHSVPKDHVLIEFKEWPGPVGAFAKVAYPRAVVALRNDGYLAVFDESILPWATSPAMVTREFLRNIAVATAMFDFVVVLCSTLQPDVERIVAAMREESRRRVRVQKGALYLKS